MANVRRVCRSRQDYFAELDVVGVGVVWCLLRLEMSCTSAVMAWHGDMTTAWMEYLHQYYSGGIHTVSARMYVLYVCTVLGVFIGTR